MTFEARLEKIFKHLKLLRFPVKRGHRCGESLWQFANSVDAILKVCRIIVICQLLKGQQSLICFDCRRGNLTAVLPLTGKTALFLLARRCTGGAACDYLVNSCNHVVAIFWPRVLRCLVLEDACFRMRITLGVVLIRSLACTQCVPGGLRSGSGVALN